MSHIADSSTGAPNVVVPGPLAQLLAHPSQMRFVAARLEAVVRNSFVQDARRDGCEPHATGAEVKRRADICTRWLRTLRCERGFSMPQTLDALPLLLRTELDGQMPDVPAPKMSTWTASVLETA